jgi:hypothetical protein
MELKCKAVAAVLHGHDGNSNFALGVGKREEKGEMKEPNEGSNDALGWLLAFFTRAWARQ